MAISSVFASRARTILGDTSGLALLEFGLTLPIWIMLTIGGIETANYAIANLRVSQISSMVADNTARVRDRIDEGDINSIMLGAKLAGEGIKLMDSGRVAVAVVEDYPATPSTTDGIVTWQRCKGVYNPGTMLLTEGQIVTAGVGSGTNKIYPKPGNPVIFAEVYYDYKTMVPPISDPIIGTTRMRYAFAYTVRDRQVQALQNGGNLGASQKATCNFFNNS